MRGGRVTQTIRRRLGKYGLATARWLFTIGAIVNFALAGTRWAGEADMATRLIAWGLFDLAMLYLFLDPDNPPQEKN